MIYSNTRRLTRLLLLRGKRHNSSDIHIECLYICEEVLALQHRLCINSTA